jgi:hypothetical protein
MSRALKCEHKAWRSLNDAEDQCEACGVIATAEGKLNLAKLRVRAL